MTKNIGIIIMGVLTVASLLLVVPFTPLRNSFPEQISNSFHNASLSVGFNMSGKLKNGREIVRVRQLEAFSIDVNTFSGKKNSVRISNPDFLNNNSTFAYSTYLQKENTNTRSGSNSGSGISLTNSTTGSKSSSGIQKVSLIPTSVKNPSNTSTTGTKTLQGATKQTYGAGQGGTHPGFDPETPIPSLPLGNGTATLLLFGLVFGFIKFKQSVE